MQTEDLARSAAVASTAATTCAPGALIEAPTEATKPLPAEAPVEAPKPAAAAATPSAPVGAPEPAAAAAAAPATFAAGARVEAFNGRYATWYPAVVVVAEAGRARVHYVGWNKRWDEWVPTADLRFTIRADAGTRADAGSPVGAKRSRPPAAGPAWSVAVWKSNLQRDFNVRVIERFGPDSSTALQELDESNRFVQKSAESTSNWPR